MGWNSSNGNGDSENPWQRHQKKQPPDLDKMLSNLWKRIVGKGNKASRLGLSNGRLFGIGISVLIVIWAITGIYVVAPAQQAVVLKFGRYTGLEGPGVHWLPIGVERNYTVDVQKINNLYYQSEMLTKDENIVSVALAVQYRVADPKNYLFNVVNPKQTLEEATASALRQVVGHMTLDSILTTGRENLRNQVQTVLAATIANYHTGLSITDVVLQPAKPPEAVTGAFDDAIKAREDEQRYINQAQAYERKVTSAAQGQVVRIQQQAQAYAQQVVSAAQGQTARYLALLTPYERAPQVTSERLYYSAMSQMLQHTHTIVMAANNHQILYTPLPSGGGSPLSTQSTTNHVLTPLVTAANQSQEGAQ